MATYFNNCTFNIINCQASQPEHGGVSFQTVVGLVAIVGVLLQAWQMFHP